MAHHPILNIKGWADFLRETPQFNSKPLHNLLYQAQDWLQNVKLLGGAGYFANDSLLYEMEERVRADEIHAMHELEKRILQEPHEGQNVVDVNCGTGISTRMIAKNPRYAKITGIDIVQNFIDFNEKLLNDSRAEFIQGDSIEVLKGMEDVDLAYLCWAYHHFPDENKQEFMNVLNGSLKPGAKATVLEMFLPEYTNETARLQSIDKLYSEAIKYSLEKLDDLGGMNAMLWDAKGGIQKFMTETATLCAEYDIDKRFEYKVSRDVFERHAKESGFEIERMEKVWPFDDKLGTGGNYIIELKKVSELVQ